MTTITELFLTKKKGLNIPSKEDSLIKIYPEQLTKKAIEKKAILYSLENLGDATCIGDVKFLKKEKVWKVPIKTCTGNVSGNIYFNSEGRFIPEKSDSEKDLLGRAERLVK